MTPGATIQTGGENNVDTGLRLKLNSLPLVQGRWGGGGSFTLGCVNLTCYKFKCIYENDRMFNSKNKGS